MGVLFTQMFYNGTDGGSWASRLQGSSLRDNTSISLCHLQPSRLNSSAYLVTGDSPDSTGSGDLSGNRAGKNLDSLADHGILLGKVSNLHSVRNRGNQYASDNVICRASSPPKE
jgi:hypothetical protein